ncbi:hypothetical protein NH8B_3241 [Pseudogulbenkiania sp. NH8B]|nr:hypothetical protein NH8B_3241 [Pseudogulbenkiania sp. NH8B]
MEAQTVARDGAMQRQFRLKGGLVTYKNESCVGMVLEKLDRCRDGDLEANVTAHCINRYGDSHQRVRW